VIFGLGATAVYTAETVRSSHDGAIPASGPQRAGHPGWPGHPGGPGGPGGFPGGGNSSSRQLQQMLTNTDNRWAAATVGSHSSGGLQLATGRPVMAIGGFSGGDDAPTLDRFQRYVRDGQVRYFIAGDRRGPHGPGRDDDADSPAMQITQWVKANFAAHTVDGNTVYDLQG
jgi:4-amino-4-deoxy-L-arabinose transferase-like glycosyltransferase